MKRAQGYILWYAGGAAILAIGLVRVLQPWNFFRPLFLPAAPLLVLPTVVAWFVLRGSARSTRELVTLTAVVTAAAWFCDHVQMLVVDNGHYFPVRQFADNTAWQKGLHAQVLRLDPNAIPHSYRFLPDALVGVLEWITGSFDAARSANRLLFLAVLYAFVFRFARVYLSAAGAVAVVGILLILFPVTNSYYAGQPIDPMSHASFVICMWAYATGYEPPVAASLVVGCLAKESVLLMAPCRAFFGKQHVKAIGLAALYSVLAFATVAGVRLLVNGGTFSYGRVSGVEPGFWSTNFAQYRQWGPQYLFTLGILLPGAALGWRLMDRPFRAMCVVVTVGVIVSSAVFSWLVEVRNLVPAVVMFAIMNIRYVEERQKAEGKSHK